MTASHVGLVVVERFLQLVGIDARERNDLLLAIHGQDRTDYLSSFIYLGRLAAPDEPESIVVPFHVGYAGLWRGALLVAVVVAFAAVLRVS